MVRPYKSLNTDLKFAGETVGVTNLVFAHDAGHITGDADYNLQTKSFRGEVQGKEIELVHIQRLQTARDQWGGALSFDLHASGTTAAPLVNGTLALEHFTLNGQSAGNVNANLHTTGHTLFVDANAMLAAAKFQAAGQMQLTGDYPVQAKLNFSQLDFAPVLTLLNVDGVKGNSQLAGVLQVSGPAKTPRLLDGTAEIDQFRVNAAGDDGDQQGSGARVADRRRGEAGTAGDGCGGHEPDRPGDCRSAG